MSANTGKIEKWLPCDRLGLVKNKEPPISVTQLIPHLNEPGCELNKQDLNGPEFYSSDSEVEHASPEPQVPRSQLRQRRIQPHCGLNLS